MHNDEHHGHGPQKGQVVDCQHCDCAGETQKDCCQHSAKACPWETAPCCVCKGEKVVRI